MKTASLVAVMLLLISAYLTLIWNMAKLPDPQRDYAAGALSVVGLVVCWAVNVVIDRVSKANME